MNDVVYETRRPDRAICARSSCAAASTTRTSGSSTTASAARGLAQAMDEIGPELIVLGASRRGTPRTLGTTAQRVIHASSCPVAIVPLGYRASRRRCTPDRSGVHADRRGPGGVEGRDRARPGGARAGPGDHRAGPQARRRAVARAAGRAAPRREPVGARGGAGAAQCRGRAGRRWSPSSAPAWTIEIDVLFNEPAEGVLAASRHVDMLIMGSRALGPKRAVLLGSVSRKVIAAATCPVVVLPRGAGAQTDALLANAEAQAAAGELSARPAGTAGRARRAGAISGGPAGAGRRRARPGASAPPRRAWRRPPRWRARA